MWSWFRCKPQTFWAQHRFSAFWLRSKCSICSYQLNIWYGGHVPPSILNWFLQGDEVQELAPASSRVGLALQYRQDRPTSPLTPENHDSSSLWMTLHYNQRQHLLPWPQKEHPSPILTQITHILNTLIFEETTVWEKPWGGFLVFWKSFWATKYQQSSGERSSFCASLLMYLFHNTLNSNHHIMSPLSFPRVKDDFCCIELWSHGFTWKNEP